MEPKALILQILCILLRQSSIKGSPLLLISNKHDVRMLDAGSPTPNRTTTLVGNLSFAGYVEFRTSENGRFIFWSDILKNTITAERVDESSVTKLWTIKQEVVSGISYDWIGKNIYWSNGIDHSVKVANFNGQHEKILFRKNVTRPGEIAVYPMGRYMFWLDRDYTLYDPHYANPRLERGAMDGDHASRTVIIRDNLTHPIALTIDYAESRIYFSDNIRKTIESCAFDGSNRRIITEFDTLSEVMSLSIYRTALYGSLFTLPDAGSREYDTYVFTCDKDTGNNFRTIADLYYALKVRVMEPERQPMVFAGNAIENPCAVNNGGCSDLCLLSPTPPYYKCACATGVQFVDNDNRTCAHGIENMLLLGRKYKFSVISLDTTDYYTDDVRVYGMYKTIGIDFDPVERNVYWLKHSGYYYIKRARFDGSGDATIMKRTLTIGGFVLDTHNRKIYFTNEKRGRIETTDLNGNSRRNVIRRLNKPHAIDIHPERGYLYWTNVGYPRTIERSRTDGSERQVLVSSGLQRPDALCVDRNDNKIYWADSQLNNIEVINEDGTGRRVLANEALTFYQGIAISGDDLYYMTWRRELMRINKRTGEGRRKILDEDRDLRTIKVIKTR